jgi:hypothetical protein
MNHPSEENLMRMNLVKYCNVKVEEINQKECREGHQIMYAKVLYFLCTPHMLICFLRILLLKSRKVIYTHKFLHINTFCVQVKSMQEMTERGGRKPAGSKRV